MGLRVITVVGFFRVIRVIRVITVVGFPRVIRVMRVIRVSGILVLLGLLGFFGGLPLPGL
jgi:hypothetical protein